jgi:uncharacterized membrane protein YkoI
MTLSLLRKSMFALAAISGLAAAPALAGDRPDETGMFYNGDDYQQVREFPRRPPPPTFEQNWNQDEDFISQREIAHMLRRQGYVQIADISLRGDQYRVTAVRRDGAVIRLRLDAYDGDVLSARPVGWAPRQDFHPHRHSESGLTIEFGFDRNR